MQTVRTTARRLRRAQRRLMLPATDGLYRAIRQAPAVARAVGLIESVRPYTMLHDDGLNGLAVEAARVLDAGIAGAFVECGTWKGGASFLMAGILEQRHDPRTVWMFDSFEGLPPTQDIDGLVGDMPWGPEHPWYQDNNAAGIDGVRRAAAALGLAHRCRMVPGWFADTVARDADAIGPIALLRLDGDLYDSTKTCLEALYHRVVPGGSVILDDYHTWDGCAVAVHEFLGARRLPHRIASPGESVGPVVIRIPSRS
jgi:O-methyltransferase